MIRILCTTILILILTNSNTAQQVDKVFLITLDGLRWQEVFGGAVDSLIDNEHFTKEKEQIVSLFQAKTKEERRKKLMPWFWSTLVNEGQLYGNKWENNKMVCTNRFWFSYPGYNEILTGISDPTIDSNEKKYNQNITVLEWLNQQEEFRGRVAAFASWDVFPYIINDQRSGIPVNAGYAPAKDKYLSIKEQVLNELLEQVPKRWGSVRFDAFTHQYMMEHVRKHKPKVVYMSYGETDDFAHDGRYDHYLLSAHQTDKWIQEIWDYINTEPFYKGTTSILISTDHGRGTSPAKEWTSHGTTVIGANEIWAAAIGPNVAPRGVMKDGKLLFQSQLAKTLAKLLGYDYPFGDEDTSDVIETIIAR